MKKKNISRRIYNSHFLFYNCIFSFLYNENNRFTSLNFDMCKKLLEYHVNGVWDSPVNVVVPYYRILTMANCLICFEVNPCISWSTSLILWISCQSIRLSIVFLCSRDDRTILACFKSWLIRFYTIWTPSFCFYLQWVRSSAKASAVMHARFQLSVIVCAFLRFWGSPQPGFLFCFILYTALAALATVNSETAPH